MRTRRTTLAIGVLSALLGASAAPVLAAPADLQSQLVEQGQYWQARNNNQRAAEVWQKVLQLDNAQVNALYGMGLIGVKQNKPQQANQYLERLQALRRTVGDEVFFRIVRRWVAERGGTSATTADFVALASDESGRDLSGFFDQWLNRSPQPALPS